MSAPAYNFAYAAPDGYDGSAATVEIMAEWVRRRATGGDGSPADLADTEQLRTRTRELFAGVESLDDFGEIRAVWDFINTHVRYQRNNLGAQHLTDPAELDRQIDEGDAAEACASLAMYAAALFAVAGRRSQFVIGEKDPKKPGEFTHAWLRVEVKRPRSGWLWFDPVGFAYWPATFQLGDTVSKPGELLELWNLDGERIARMAYNETDPYNAMLGDAGQEALSIIDQIAGGASAAGPYGALFGGAIKAGEGIAAAAGSQTAKNYLAQGGAKAQADKAAKDKAAAGASWWDKLPTWQKVAGIAGAAVVGGSILKRVL